jgi:small GTP-binding protein
MADIFISYAREDLETAKTLAQALADQSWSVWWDTRLQAGEVWSEVIERELKAARCVVVLWSKTSVQSHWVREEATEGLERRILVPALIEDVQPPLPFGGIQAEHLIDWYGEQSHTGFKRLVDAVASRIGLPEQTRATSSFFRARGGKRSLNEAKLILVGFGGVGKTSLVNRIVRGKSFDHYERMTEGIAITDWSLRLHSEDVRLHVWDFGGQEIMHATHQFFLTARSLYLLVLNGRQGREDADAEYWLNMIKSLAADSPVIVILNKIQEHPFDINRRALQGKFSNIKAFVETDCSDDTGLADLHRLIREETDRLPHLRDTFPAAWFAIKDQLAEMAESYLTFDAYQQLCTQHGECDEEGQERLASFLHILGVALNYRDDPRLHDTHVLKPEWVTQGIYSILNAKRLAAEYGELTLGELKEILNATRYPRAQHLFLIELMRKFELCFRFPDADDRFLVPELLDKQEPELTSRFVAKDILAFEYHYPGLLPEGLLPRFIVRTSALRTYFGRECLDLRAFGDGGSDGQVGPGRRLAAAG